MLWRRYVLSCSGCNTEFCFKNKSYRKFYADHNGNCPCCGDSLSVAPFPHMMLTMPPQLMKIYPEYVRRIDMDEYGNSGRLLDFDKWPKLN